MDQGRAEEELTEWKIHATLTTLSSVEIRYTKIARKALDRMPANTARLIRGKIEQYAAAPTTLANNIKKLQGRDGYRLRVGDWRIIFDQDGAVLDVLEIGHRGSIYED